MIQNRETWVVVYNELGHSCDFNLSCVMDLFPVDGITGSCTMYQRNLWAAWRWCRKSNSGTWIKYRKISTVWKGMLQKNVGKWFMVRKEEVVSATFSTLVLSEPVGLENKLPILLSSDSFSFSSFWQKYLL